MSGPKATAGDPAALAALEAAGPPPLPEARDRKAEHIRLALDERMQLGSSPFDEYRFEHQALPEIDFGEIDVSVEFLGRRLAAPLLISCMTGGTETAGRINRNLAAGAQRTGVAVGVGSQRKALEDPGKADTFRVREVAPSVPLLANLGAVQLNYGMGVSECRRAVEMIGADALVLHLNPLQEAIQPEGQCNFSGLLPKIGEVVREVGVPVAVKEIGCGIAESTARALAGVGVRIVDTAGVGGTSWARIEAQRAGDPEIGEIFAGWGLPTPESVRQVRRVEGLTVIASGGLRNGLDAAKAIALGADLVGMAYPFLAPATESPERVAEKVRRTVRELKICMFCLGVKTLAELRGTKLLKGL
ncbi:MAG TPA: type 2 isopentenyl-diphosphate Delta-isomerase [Thermoanaerobaculia bacterium]|nr:type 2 isopentenyl-diphosphate Delta-isomerase [Thermoanaerobaculia bacterium]